MSYSESWEGVTKVYSVCSKSMVMGVVGEARRKAKGWIVQSVEMVSSRRVKGRPRRRSEMDGGVSWVSSAISRRAAARGLASVGSIVPEQTAHLPLVCVRDGCALGSFFGGGGRHVFLSM